MPFKGLSNIQTTLWLAPYSPLSGNQFLCKSFYLTRSFVSRSQSSQRAKNQLGLQSLEECPGSRGRWLEFTVMASSLSVTRLQRDLLCSSCRLAFACFCVSDSPAPDHANKLHLCLRESYLGLLLATKTSTNCTRDEHALCIFSFAKPAANVLAKSWANAIQTIVATAMYMRR